MKAGMKTTPLQFNTREEAQAWLTKTGHYGMIAECFGYFIVQFHDGAAWAFVSETELVHLPDW